MRRPLSFSFEPFAYGKDRNRLNARATRCRTKVRRARERSGGQRYRSTKRSKRKNFRTGIYRRQTT